MAHLPRDLAAATEDVKREPAGVIKGIALGLANVFVIAIGIAGGHDPAAILFIMMYGGLPAVVLGGLLGALAEFTARRSPWWRAVLLALPAFGLVLGLGTLFMFTAAIPVACIPTLVAALVLERWTRQVEPAPVATARSLRR